MSPTIYQSIGKKRYLSTPITTALENIGSHAILDRRYIHPFYKIYRPPWKFDNIYNERIEHDIIIEKDSKEKNDWKEREALKVLAIGDKMKTNGNFKRARQVLEHAEQLAPKNIEILTSLGELYELINEYLLANQMYHRAIHINKKQAFVAQKKQSELLSIVEEIDQELLEKIDNYLQLLYRTSNSIQSSTKRKNDGYFYFIYHSNAIEGNQLNLSQTEYIVRTKLAIGNHSLIEQQEVLGLDAALRYINITFLTKNVRKSNSYRPFQYFGRETLLKIHQYLLGYVNPIEAGHFRQRQVYVGNHVPPPSSELEDLLDEFFIWLNSEQVQMLHPIEFAALAHYKFVYIHPFHDGNGRTGRIIMNLILMGVGYPPVTIKQEDRLEYYKYLNIANEGDIRPFIRFIAQCAKQAIDYYLKMNDDASSITSSTESPEFIH
ncbi:hypothetical protein SNEBB_003863 [Seison nebaliae]|nr:hypothetical protein SNEBB_003863 [Seison nebaliae]